MKFTPFIVAPRIHNNHLKNGRFGIFERGENLQQYNTLCI